MPRKRIHRVLPIVAGMSLISATFIAQFAVNDLNFSQLIDGGFVVSGCTFVVLGLLLRDHRFSSALAKASLAVLSLVVMAATAEGVFRAIGFDFGRLNRRELPIYFTHPTFPAGGGVFRRPGPSSWRGKPLSSLLRVRWGHEGAYPNEQVIEIRYDDQGFRNGADLADWEVVVTGDSFVELGFLPFEDIFTTICAKRLGVRVKNLGVAGTGTIFQTSYVRNYGKAASTTDAVLCFFEGNDAMDLAYETRATNFIRNAKYREHPRQVSLLTAISDQWRLRGRPLGRTKLIPNGYVIAGNEEHPIAGGINTPRAWDELSQTEQEQVIAAISNWGVTARSLGLRPWLMCIPDSHRVFHGHIRHADTNSMEARWRPGEFGSHLARICADHGVYFIDPFPALRREMDAGTVPYNTFGDAHLNAHGSRVVAEVLAEALKSRGIAR